MIAIGVAHTAFGPVIFGDLLWPALGEGLFDKTASLAAPSGRRVAFWYMFMGFAVLLLGMLMDGLAARHAASRIAGMGAGVLALVGALMMPASGFWLLLVPARASSPVLAGMSPRPRLSRSNKRFQLARRSAWLH